MNGRSAETHLVLISEECIQNIDNNKYSEPDPLHGFGEDHNEKFYHLNEEVFAVPVPVDVEQNKGTKCDKDESEYTFMDKVIVQRRPSNKYRKFHIDLEQDSSICPQQNCGKSFKTQSLLKAHIRKVHCAVCKFVCGTCGKTFPFKYLLVRHMAVHEKLTVECPVCKKSLSATSSLSVHLRTHTNTRPFECDICHKRFLRRFTMKNHLKFVHGNESIACEKCLKRFARRYQYTRHKCGGTHTSEGDTTK